MNATHPPASGPATDTPTRRRRFPRHVATIIALPAGLAIVGTGCFYEEGSGEIETVAFEDFDEFEVTGISVQDTLDVLVRVDPALPQTATVTTDDNLVDNGAATIDEDGTLTFGFDGLTIVDPSQTPIVTLTLRSLETIENHADGEVVVTGIDGGIVEIVNGGHGTITAAGRADAIDLSVSSGGDVDLTRLRAGNVELEDTDDGAIEVYATDAIEGSISGDGDVVVHGDPATTDVEIDGDGELIVA
jgi:hypothetical protein